MSSEQITAAHDSVTSAIGLITELVGGNIEVIFALFAVTGIVGIFAAMIIGIYSAVGIRKIP